MNEIDFDALNVGDSIPSLSKGPLTPAHIMRWSSAMENWHRIHYDWRFATQHDKLPDILVNGSWKQHVMIQLLTDWVGEGGWVWKVGFQFRGMSLPGETLTAWGTVKSKSDFGPYGLAELEVGLRNQDGVESTPGSATVVLQRRNGPPVPYPFRPSEILKDGAGR